MTSENNRDSSTILLSASEQYLWAAKRLSTQELEADHIKLPRIHLLAHGIELLLKANLLRCGVSEQTLRSRIYRHNLRAMWDMPESESVKETTYRVMPKMLQFAAESDRWRDRLMASGDQGASFEQMFNRLSEIHGSENNYALRYPATHYLDAIQPYLLIDTFLGTCSLLLLEWQQQ